MLLVLTLTSLLWTTPTPVTAPVAPDGQVQERLLLPVATEPLPGANGSRWETDLWVVLKTNTARFGPLVNRNCRQPGCGPPASPLPFAFDAVQPDIYRTRAGELPGVLLFTPPEDLDGLVFSLRVADTSRRSLSAGVNIPVIRERDLLTGSAHLLNVTAGPDVRVRLRIYDPFLTGDALFQVRVFDAGVEDRLLEEREVTLLRPVYEPFSNWPYPLQPDSAELDIDVSGLAGKVLRIDVVPHNPALRFWTFATITNQVTSEVTIVTP
jgi:hypothetical protein